MSFFERVRKWIVNAWNVNNRYQPYFKSLNCALDNLENIKEGIDPDITRIYNRIKATAPLKYAKEIARYEEIDAKLKEHNEKVAEINEGKSRFDYNKILDNPHDFDYSSLPKYIEIVDLIKAFPKHDASYDKLVKEVENVQKYYYSMVEEYDAVHECNKIEEILSSFGYVDSKLKSRLIERRKSLKQKALNHEKNFLFLER